MKVVGYWLSDKKIVKTKIVEFANNYKSKDLKFIKLDLTRSLEDQGPIHLIFHKFMELTASANHGDSTAQEQLTRVQTYLANNPEVICVDSIERTTAMIGREYQLKETARCCAHPNINKVAFVPNFCLLETSDPSQAAQLLREAGVSFPILCKPAMAHGPSSAHEMAILFNEESLKEVTTPYVAQSFLNHDAVLYKVYVSGPSSDVCERRSVRNLTAGASPPLYFHTHEVSKSKTASPLNGSAELATNTKTRTPDHEVLKEIAQTFRQVSQIDFFGLDIFLPTDSDKYAVVDFNSFPGYESVPNFYNNVVNLIRKKLSLPAEE